MLRDCEFIKQELDKILIEVEDLKIKLSSPEVVVDKMLTKYFTARFNKLNKVTTYIDEFNEGLELIKNEEADFSLINDSLLKILDFYTLNAQSKSATIECSANKDSELILLKLIKEYLNDSKLEYSCNQNIISVDCVGAYEKVQVLNGLYLACNKKAYVYVTTLDNLNFMFDENKVKIDIFRASKRGGQNVNKVESAIRATYLDTQDVVICQDERSQLQNKQKAIERLKALVEENWKKKVAHKISEAKANINNINEVSMQLNKDTTKEEFYIQLLKKAICENNKGR